MLNKRVQPSLAKPRAADAWRLARPNVAVKKISSAFTTFYKKIFPSLCFGFLAFVVIWSATAGELENTFMVIIVRL
jgi:hypothetical protein